MDRQQLHAPAVKTSGFHALSYGTAFAPRQWFSYTPGKTI